MYVPSVLLDFGDPVETVRNIRERTTLFRFGIAGRLVTQLLYIVIPFYLYQLFKNLDKVTSALMLLFSVISVPISMYIESLKLSTLDMLDRPNDVMELLDHYNHALGISTIFWGLWLLPLGRLVYKASYFPKLIGISLLTGGFGYLIGAFFDILFPDFDQLNTIWETMTMGELIFIIWFVVMGVRYRGQGSDG